MSINYGEEQAYWYLRLNGFFTINNFVLHHDERARTSDADILAVRFPYVYEETGGEEKDWDHRPFINHGEDKIIGIICEVKTGPSYNSQQLFKEANLRKALGRFGFFEHLSLGNYANELSNEKYLKVGKYEIHKVLIANKRKLSRDDYHYVDLREINKFIMDRMYLYKERKFADRMFFQSPLLQYMIWKQQKKETEF